MSKNSIIIIAVIAIIIFVNFDEWMSSSPSKPANSQVNNKAATKSNKSQNNTYAMRAADNRWPSMDTAQAIVVDDLSTKNYYLVFDGSGSMERSECSNGQAKIEVAKRSVVEFISKIPGDANVGLLVFDNRGVYERAVLGSSSKSQAIKAVNQARAGGGTPLRSSISHAYQALSQQAEKQLGYGEYHLIVVTDGAASDGENPNGVVNTLIQNSPVVLHTIGFCIGGDHSLNQAGLTIYKSANNPLELTRGLDSVLAEASDFNIDSFEGQVQ